MERVAVEFRVPFAPLASEYARLDLLAQPKRFANV